MGTLPGWMPILLDRINWGCSTSPWFVDLADEHMVLIRGRKIILDLWPFISELPLNIAAVRATVPEHMTAAKKLLNRLADSELQYQKLFLQQFDLAGIKADEIAFENTNQQTQELCFAMAKVCTQAHYVDGIYAIVAAELSATMYCRLSLPLYERYFQKRSKEYDPELINAGLEWLRLHAKTHTRHAIWMMRMLNDIAGEASSITHGIGTINTPGAESDDIYGMVSNTSARTTSEIPTAAAVILNAVLALWECPLGSPQVIKSGIS